MHAELTTLEEARRSPEKQEWNQAMQMKSLKDNDVWELIDCPTSWEESYWEQMGFKVKTGGDGSIKQVL